MLIGYSFGSLIALELAKRLEKQGLSGRLVLIDGAPEYLKMAIEQFLPSTTNEELQNNILLAIMDTMQSALSGKVDNLKNAKILFYHILVLIVTNIPFLFPQLLLDLEKCTTWDEKLDNFVSHIADDKMSLSIEHKKALCTTIYMNILALQKYDLSSFERIRAPIILLKPTLQLIDTPEEDYGLHKVICFFYVLFTTVRDLISRNRYLTQHKKFQLTRDKVEVYYVEGNHLTMLDSDRVVTAINGESLYDPKAFRKLLLEDRPFDADIEERSRD